MPPTQSSTAAAASKKPPASKTRQKKTPLENNDTTNQEVRATRKKRTMDDVSKDSQEDSALPDGPDKAKGRRGPGKRQRRSASPMSPPATKKRVPTNNHPGLIGKKTRRSKAEIAADKAIKESEAAIAAAVEEKTLTRLAEIELEQESMEKIRLEEIIRKRPHCAPAAATNITDSDAAQGDVSHGDNPTSMNVDSEVEEDLSHLMDVDYSGDSDDDNDLSDDSDSTEKETTKKVLLPVFDCVVSTNITSRNRQTRKEVFWQKSQPRRKRFNRKSQVAKKSELISRGRARPLSISVSDSPRTGMPLDH
jgi:hypothetical protein